MKQIVILNLMIFLSLTKDNYDTQGRTESKDYHMRRVYYSQNQNVCRGDQQFQRRDVFKIQIAVHDKLIQDVVVTLTSCGIIQLICWDNINIQPEIIYSWNWRQHDEHDKITFLQQLHKTFIGTLGLGMTVKTSIDQKRPAIIQGVPHDCKVQGDSTLHHFGYYKDTEPPTIKVFCSKKLNVVEE